MRRVSRRTLGLGMAIAALLVTGCGGLRLTGPGRGSVAITSVAVLDFGSPEAEDACVTGVLGAGLRAVERRRVDVVLHEHDMSRAGEQSAEFYRELGRMTGADAFITGSVAGAPPARLVTRARLVLAETGDIVLVAEYDSLATGNTGMGDIERVCREISAGQPTR